MSKNCVLENKTDGNKSLVSKVQHKTNSFIYIRQI